MKKIEVNDIVRVTDWGKQFSSNTAWFNEHRTELNLDWIIRYAYKDSRHYVEHQYDDNNRYKVLFVDTQYNKALISSYTHFFSSEYEEVYLIGIGGIELYDKPTEMTISEIEEKLGVKNLKIIKENNNG